jgi:hypothetical protein
MKAKPLLISAPPHLWPLVEQLEAAGLAVQLTPVHQLHNRRRPRVSPKLHHSLATVLPN